MQVKSQLKIDLLPSFLIRFSWKFVIYKALENKTTFLQQFLRFLWNIPTSFLRELVEQRAETLERVS